MLYLKKKLEEYRNKKKLKHLVNHFSGKFTGKELEEMIGEFKIPALDYVRKITDYAILHYDTETSQFDSMFYNLFSHQEVALMKQNIKGGREPMEGVVFSKNGKYDMGQTFSFYSLSKLFYEADLKGKLDEPTQKQLEELVKKTESSRIYKQFMYLHDQIRQTAKKEKDKEI